ncbi:unnamed protein product [Arctogadus glacialis]
MIQGIGEEDMAAEIWLREGTPTPPAKSNRRPLRWLLGNAPENALLLRASRRNHQSSRFEKEHKTARVKPQGETGTLPSGPHESFLSPTPLASLPSPVAQQAVTSDLGTWYSRTRQLRGRVEPLAGGPPRCPWASSTGHRDNQSWPGGPLAPEPGLAASRTQTGDRRDARAKRCDWSSPKGWSKVELYRGQVE